MADNRAISNTSSMLYLHRIDALNWLPLLFAEIRTPDAVARELEEGQLRGYDVPNVATYPWLQVEAQSILLPATRQPALGPGEVAAISLALQYPGCVLLLDDAAARRVAENAGCKVWGTLRVVLEAKRQGMIVTVAPVLDELAASGMWLSSEIRERILRLAGE